MSSLEPQGSHPSALWSRPRALMQVLQGWASARPELPFVLELSSGTRCSYGEAWETVLRLLPLLQARGVRPRSRMVLVARSRGEQFCGSALDGRR